MRVLTVRWVASCAAVGSVALMAGALVLTYVDRHLVPADMAGWNFSGVFEGVANLAVPVVGVCPGVPAAREPRRLAVPGGGPGAGTGWLLVRLRAACPGRGRRHIGLVFQFFNLLEGMTVLENVALPAVIAGRRRKMAETRAADLLDLLGIADKARAVPGVLSGGQRQRLAIARALANEPTLLLADEPTGALDSEGGEEVIELLRRLHDGGQTIVLVTHDASVAAAAGRVVRMRDGRIAEPEPELQPDGGEAVVIEAL